MYLRLCNWSKVDQSKVIISCSGNVEAKLKSKASELKLYFDGITEIFINDKKLDE